MQARISKRAALAVPSASDVEVVDGIIYVVGDDSPYLYCLDADWNITRRVLLFEVEAYSGGRMAKAIKPDFEAMTAVRQNGVTQLLIFGSGSRSPQRDFCFVVDLANAANAEHLPVRQVSLATLYDELRGHAQVAGAGKLNIEGAATTREHVVLFQRGNITGNNVALYYPTEAFMAYLADNTRPAPVPEIYRYTLPSINGVRAGFSGACLLPDDEHILFAAAVENTTNEIDDGETLGSFLGVIPALGQAGGDAQPLYALLTQDADGQTYRGKIESVAVLSSSAPDHLSVLAATDDDQGGSEILQIEIT